MIYQSEAPAPEEIDVHKYRRHKSFYTYSLSLATLETGLTVVTRVSVMP